MATAKTEFDVGPVLLTRPTSEVTQHDLTQNQSETLDPTQPKFQPIFAQLLVVEKLCDKVKILWATLDSNLTMEPHTKALSYSFVQANSFIFRWWYGRFCRVSTR